MRTVLPSLVLALAAASHAQGPNLTALAAIVIEAKSGRVLYQKNADLPLPPASTTKVMTGLLFVEHCQPTDNVYAPLDANTVGESSMHLVPGEQLDAENLLYGVMLRSANDGCHAIACHIAENDDAFAKVMNERAKQLGCTGTNFVNPHGLPDPKHLTTAHDLVRIGQAAMRNPWFAKTVRTQKKVIRRGSNQLDTLIKNRDTWLSLDSTALGIKTGFTKEAGHCFVGCAERNGLRVITAIMKSQNWIADQQALVEWTYSNFQAATVVRAGDKFGEAKVDSGRSASVPLVAARDLATAVRKDGSDGQPKLETPNRRANAPVQLAQEMGDGKLVFGDGDSLVVALRAGAAVEKQWPVVRAATQPGAWVAIALMAGALALRRKSRRFFSPDSSGGKK